MPNISIYIGGNMSGNNATVHVHVWTLKMGKWGREQLNSENISFSHICASLLTIQVQPKVGWTKHSSVWGSNSYGIHIFLAWAWHFIDRCGVFPTLLYYLKWLSSIFADRMGIAVYMLNLENDIVSSHTRHESYEIV